MGEITNDAAIMAALGRHMTRAVQRQSVAAGNLANLDTPGYRTQEAKFADSLDQELGDGWADGVHPGDRERCLATYAEAFDARREFTMEYRLRRHDGEHRWVVDKGVPRRTPEGTFVGYIGCADDITPQREAELVSERHRAELAHVARLSTMGELSASLAHELNQPLAAILGNAETAEKMLRRDNVDLEELRAICNDIVSENHRATEVMRRMRALVSKQPPALAAVDVGTMIHDVVRLEDRYGRSS